MDCDKKTRHVTSPFQRLVERRRRSERENNSSRDVHLSTSRQEGRSKAKTKQKTNKKNYICTVTILHRGQHAVVRLDHSPDPRCLFELSLCIYKYNIMNA